jgi:hypothetical protein
MKYSITILLCACFVMLPIKSRAETMTNCPLLSVESEQIKPQGAPIIMGCIVLVVGLYAAWKLSKLCDALLPTVPPTTPNQPPPPPPATNPPPKKLTSSLLTVTTANATTIPAFNDFTPDVRSIYPFYPAPNGEEYNKWFMLLMDTSTNLVDWETMMIQAYLSQNWILLQVTNIHSSNVFLQTFDQDFQIPSGFPENEPQRFFRRRVAPYELELGE